MIKCIFPQALLMHPVLLRKVRQWAALAGGLFRSADSGFVALPPEAPAPTPAAPGLFGFGRIESSAWPRQARAMCLCASRGVPCSARDPELVRFSMLHLSRRTETVSVIRPA